MKRCLVSGASGFIGRHLVKHLKNQGCAVHGFSRTMPTSGTAEICDAYSLADLMTASAEQLTRLCAGVDTLFHLAGPAQSNTQDHALHQRVHVEGTRTLLQVALATGVDRVVYFSTVKAITPGPDDAYGQAKQDAEALIRNTVHQHAIRAVLVRPVAVYGAGTQGYLATLLKAVRYSRGYMPLLPDTHNRRSLVHVDDLVTAACLAAQAPLTGCPIYTITDGQNYSSRQIQTLMRQALGQQGAGIALPDMCWHSLAILGDSLQRVTGRAAPFNSALLARLTESAVYDNKQACQELGFQPQHTLAGALPEWIADCYGAQI